jgi:dTDP-4-dehydrorhamnose reductase
VASVMEGRRIELKRLPLIIGGDSVIGSALGKSWREEGILCHASTRRYISSDPNIPFIDLCKGSRYPNCSPYCSIVFCAGITSNRACEASQEKSRETNVTRPIVLAERLSQQGKFFLFLSTAQVFDGEEANRAPSDPVGPVTLYGEQKVEVEQRILGLSHTAVLRLPRIDDPRGSLLREWAKRLRQDLEINPYAGVTISIVPIGRVLEKVTEIVRNRSSGLYHVASTENILLEDYARRYCRLWGFSDHLVVPQKTDHDSHIAKYGSLVE